MAMFRKEKALPCCGPPEGPQSERRRTIMVSERLRKRKKMTLQGRPLRKPLVV